ncbi:hypothetical protein, partial [Rubrivirga sp.]|uniref:hypothetical protein n=1 Tax=Rubrivirga sp. TaxID=1885344 RepID=UPI003C74C824
MSPALAQGGRVEINVTDPAAGLRVQATIAFLDTRPQSAALFVRPLGDATYQRVEGVDQGGGIWLVDLPFVYPAQGVEGYAQYVLDGQTFTEPVDNPETAPVRVPAFIAAITSDISLPSRLNRMVTIPVVLGELANSPQELGSDNPIDVLGQTFGSSGDPSLWRAFRWNAPEQRYRDAVTDPGSVRIRPGRGFWLVTAQGGTFKVTEGLSAGVAFEDGDPQAVPVVVRLQSGWNQIGNPYLFPIQWSDVERPAGVEDPVAHEPGPDNGRYVGGQSTLRTWEGYFVFNTGPPTDIQFRVRPGGSQARTGDRPIAERIRERAGRDASVLGITARSGDLEDAVYLGRDGVVTDAPIDLRKPAALGRSFRLSVVSDGQDWIGRFQDGVWTLGLEADTDATLDLQAFGDWPGFVVEDVD